MNHIKRSKKAVFVSQAQSKAPWRSNYSNGCTHHFLEGMFSLAFVSKATTHHFLWLPGDMSEEAPLCERRRLSGNDQLLQIGLKAAGTENRLTGPVPPREKKVWAKVGIAVDAVFTRWARRCVFLSLSDKEAVMRRRRLAMSSLAKRKRDQGLLAGCLRLGLLLTVAAAAAVGCSGDDAASQEATPSESGSSSDTPHRIQFYAGVGENTRPMSVGPTKSLWNGTFGATTPTKASGGVDHLGLRFTNTPPFENPLPDSEDPADWYFVATAIRACGGWPVHELPFPVEEPPDTFYFLQGLMAGSCDEQTAGMQVLLCAADKLEEIANGTGPVVWLIPQGSPTDAFGPPLPLTFPPQHPRSRFIARDLAIHTIAHIVWLDMLKPSASSGTCGDRYAKVATGDLTDVNVFKPKDTEGTHIEKVRDLPWPFENYDVEISSADLPGLAKTRIDFRAHILRAASRLLETLVHDSVYADLAGGARRRAREGDFLRGQMALWGKRETEEGGYNSLAHAVRVINQRWQRPRRLLAPWTSLTSSGDCSAIVPGDALSEQGYGTDLSARYLNMPIQTKGQRDALVMLESSGVVFDSRVFAESLTAAQIATQIRDATTSQLLWAGAKGLGVEKEVYEQTPAGKLALKRFECTGDEDLNDAAKSIFDRYRLLTNSSDNHVGTFEGAVAVETEAMASVAPLQVDPNLPAGALVLRRPMTRNDLALDSPARFGKLQSVAQCPESGSSAQAFGTDGAFDFAMQDSFSLAQALSSRLVALREAAEGVSGLDETAKLLEAAAFEAQAWSGQGRIQAFAEGATTPEMLYVLFLGFQLEDFGASNVADMGGGRLELVWGDSFVAECVAGLRTSCPENLQDYVASVSAPDFRSLADGAQQVNVPIFTGDAFESWTEVPAADARRFYGVDGTWGMVVIDPGTPRGAKFLPKFGAAGTTSIGADRLYVVLKSDPASIDGKGKVLGALTLHNQGLTTIPVSSKQQKLLNVALGVSKSHLLGKMAVGTRTLSDSDSYCIEDVPKDIHVPMENELTSDGDDTESSWKYYIQRAKEAAQRADELGDKMLDWGLTKEYRREAANEKLAEVCGAYAMVDETNFANGKVLPGAADGPLVSCLDKSRSDVVFLGKAPSQIEAVKDNSVERTSLLKQDVLRCSSDPRSHLCDKPTLTFGTLALEEVEAPDVAEPPDCRLQLEAADGLKRGYQGGELQEMSNQAWMESLSLASPLKRLQMVERYECDLAYCSRGAQEEGWKVTWHGETFIDSLDQAYWPACVGRTNGCPDGELASKLGRLFGTEDMTEPLDHTLLVNLRWRVEGALWTLGGLAGTIPNGLFDVEVPVANFNNADESIDWSTPLAVPAIYASGLMAASGGYYRLSVSPDQKGMSEGSVGALDDAHKWSRYWQAYDVLYNWHMPAWLREFWNDAVQTNYLSQNLRYLVAPAKNSERPLQPTDQMKTHVHTIGKSLTGGTCGLPLFTSYDSEMSAPDIARYWVQWIKSEAWLGENYFEGLSVCPRPNGDKSPYLSYSRFPQGNGVVADPELTAPLFLNGVGSSKGYGINDQGQHSYGYFEELVPAAVGKPFDQVWWHVALPTNFPLPLSTKLSYSNFVDPDPTDGSYYWSAYYLEPKNCSGRQRVAMFVNSYPPRDACDAGAQLIGALGLACVASAAPMAIPLDRPPSITSNNSLPVLAAWIQKLGIQAAQQASLLYVEGIPTRVLDDFQAGTVGTGSNRGKVGQKRLEIGRNLESVQTSWGKVGDTLALLGNSMADAGLQIEGNDLTLEGEQAELARQQIQVWKDAAVAASKLLGVAGLGTIVNPGDKLGAAGEALIEAERLLEETARIEQLGRLAEAQAENSEARILVNLNREVILAFGDVRDRLSDIRGAVAAIKISTSELDQLIAEAELQAANAAGDDYANIDGEPVSLPVNTILNRQYDVTRLRYERAFKEARYLAFLARVAIEQRIGARLDAVSFPYDLGPMQSPAVWADDICGMQGIDFTKYKRSSPPVGTDNSAFDTSSDAGTSATLKLPESLILPKNRRELLGFLNQERAIDDLAGQYVADYVASLENFVAFYNQEFPAHEGDDTMVLSLGDDLLPNTEACTVTSSNLLLHSGDLTRRDHVNVSDQLVVRGWETRGCDSGPEPRCLRVLPSTALEYPDPPAEITGAGVSFLSEYVPVTIDPPSGGWPDDAGAALPPDDPTETRTVRQQVYLTGATPYVVSWWDSARSETGGLPTSEPSLLRISVRDENGVLVEKIYSYVPHKATSETKWSERRWKGFEVPGAGSYTIGISVSDQADANRGHVAIAGLQLEAASSKDSKPSPYEETRSSRLRPSASCGGSTPEQVQGAFRYRCGLHDRCYYELAHPIDINTTDLARRPYYLNGKLAQGNFNYRHMTFAINLMGTGVLDCSNDSSSSCHAMSTVDYSVNHEAFKVDITGWNGLARDFNFGAAKIHDGKALAAERLITVPIGSADGALLDQEGITKGEFRGRPLDGSYKIRIWDRPGLQWSQLEDVQIILKYRYWSPINVEPPPGKCGW